MSVKSVMLVIMIGVILVVGRYLLSYQATPIEPVPPQVSEDQTNMFALF